MASLDLHNGLLLLKRNLAARGALGFDMCHFHNDIRLLRYLHILAFLGYLLNILDWLEIFIGRTKNNCTIAHSLLCNYSFLFLSFLLRLVVACNLFLILHEIIVK